jgi:hypothetical protein
VVGGDEGVDSLRLADLTDRCSLADQLHATTIQLVHPSEVGDELGDKLVPLVAVALVADRGLQAGSPEQHGLIPPLARFVNRAQLFAEHLLAD